MKKILLFLLVLSVVFSSCGLKRGIGLVNNDITLRDWYGGTCLELSAEAGVRSSFFGNAYTSGQYWDKSEYADYITNVDFSFAVYETLYKNNIIKLNAGALYGDILQIRYNEYADHSFNLGYDYYSHQISMDCNYAYEQSVAIIFPDIEISTPFSDDLKFILKADLIRCNIYLHSSTIDYRFTEQNDTKSGKYHSQTSFSTGYAYIDHLTISSTYLNMGNLKIGLVYFFK